MGLTGSRDWISSQIFRVFFELAFTVVHYQGTLVLSLLRENYQILDRNFRWLVRFVGCRKFVRSGLGCGKKSRLRILSCFCRNPAFDSFYHEKKFFDYAEDWIMIGQVVLDSTRL